MVKNTLKASECLSKNLKLLREATGLSLSEIGNSSGLSKQSIWNFENGRRFPSCGALAAISKAFNVNETDLFNPMLKIKHK